MRVKPRRWLERLLLAAGILCLGYYAYQTAEAHQFQQQQARAFEELLSERPARGDVRLGLEETLAEVRAESASTSVLAMLEIPRLAVSTPVVSGDSEAVLRVAVGHLPDTPRPWEQGNTAFAAHRDGLFRPLRRIKVGDELRVRTTHGDFVYRVRETKIVEPDDLSVLAPTPRPTLTLITCYPFNFLGNAPQRFIVHADRVDASFPSN